jgi:hypothetical protein
MKFWEEGLGQAVGLGDDGFREVGESRPRGVEVVCCVSEMVSVGGLMYVVMEEGVVGRGVGKMGRVWRRRTIV